MNNSRCVIKVKKKKIERDTINYSKFNKAIDITNDIINLGGLFMRSYVLYIIENNNNPEKTKISEPIINNNFIRNSFSVIMIDNLPKKGRPFNEEKHELIKNLKLYFDIFKKETGIKSIVATNISYILGQSYEQIYISIINNIKYHFDKHLWKYIKSSFIQEYEIIRELKDSNKLKEYHAGLEKVKNDIYNGTTTCDIKYNEWVKTNRSLIIPFTYTESKFESDVEKNTFSYIKCMCYMNNFIQTKELKSYQIFPIKTNCYQNYIKINTSALIDLFYDSEVETQSKIEFLTKAGNIDFQEEIWNKYFYLKNENGYLFKHKGFSFNYELETDGFAVSLNFINNNEIQNKEKKKAAFRKGRQSSSKSKKNMTTKEYNLFLKEKEENKLKKIEEQKILNKQIRDNKRKEFNKLSKEEKELVKNKMNETAEFPYIEKLLSNEQRRAEFKKSYDDGKIVVCDPGKRSPLYLMACNKNIHIPKKKLTKNNFGISVKNDRKFMNYTIGTRLNYLKRGKYGQLTESWKCKNPTNSPKTLKDLEKELSLLNSKSCNHSNFILYIKKKQEYDKKVSSEYNTVYLRRLRWYGYLNKMKHENELLSQIANEFGEDIKIVIGDWSTSGCIRFTPVPNIGLKRKLAQRFDVYFIDEYKTSIIHNKYHVECGHLKVKNDTLIKKPKSNKAKNIKNKKNKKRKNKKYSLKKMSTKNLVKTKTKIKTKPVPIIKNILDVNELKENNLKPIFDYKYLHSVLTYKIVKELMECKIVEQGCINRDKNSVLNMESIFCELLISGNRPQIFSRTTNQSDRKVNPTAASGTLRGDIINQTKNQTSKINKLKPVKKSANKPIQNKNTNASNSKTLKKRSLKKVNPINKSSNKKYNIV